jgi:lysine/ornithine N-monooxygenase
MSNEIRPITAPEAVREARAKVLKAAKNRTDGSVKIRVKSATEEDEQTRRLAGTDFLVTGYQHALRAVLQGVAEVVEE